MANVTVQSSQVWDHRQGCYVTVTDVIDPVHGASRLTGFVRSDTAIAMCEKARKTMQQPTLRIV